MPATDASAPSASKRDGARSRDSRRTSWPATSATTTSGSLARNTEPQAKCSSSHPPVTGPIATESPVTADQTPIAVARSRAPGKAVISSASVAGKISAAAAPMSARAVTSSPVVSAVAASSEVRPYSASPSCSMRRRP